MGHRLGIVIPARNEVDRLGQVLESLLNHIDGCDQLHRIVVDDGSTDATLQIAARYAIVVRHAINLGKGAALKTGCDVAIQRGCDLIAVMDADGQHQSADLPKLLQPLVTDTADLCLAFRSFAKPMPPAMRLGNWGLSQGFRVLLGTPFRDTQCGFRAFTAGAYKRVRWHAAGYAVETEMLMRAARAGLRIAEVPIETMYHDRYKGTTIVDGLHILASMLRWRFSETL